MAIVARRARPTDHTTPHWTTRVPNPTKSARWGGRTEIGRNLRPERLGSQDSYSPSCLPMLSFMIPWVPPPIGARFTSYTRMLVFFSNNLGCLGSLFVSALGTLILLILLDVI
jgi:hypothetical protein